VRGGGGKRNTISFDKVYRQRGEEKEKHCDPGKRGESTIGSERERGKLGNAEKSKKTAIRGGKKRCSPR